MLRYNCDDVGGFEFLAFPILLEVPGGGYTVFPDSVDAGSEAVHPHHHRKRTLPGKPNGRLATMPRKLDDVGLTVVDRSRDTLCNASAVGGCLNERGVEGPSGDAPVLDTGLVIGKTNDGHPRQRRR